MHYKCKNQTIINDVALLVVLLSQSNSHGTVSDSYNQHPGKITEEKQNITLAKNYLNITYIHRSQKNRPKHVHKYVSGFTSTSSGHWVCALEGVFDSFQAVQSKANTKSTLLHKQPIDIMTIYWKEIKFLFSISSFFATVLSEEELSIQHTLLYLLK